jgi:small multidrug resistance pump
MRVPLSTHLPPLLAHAGAGTTADGLTPLLALRGGMTLTQGWGCLFAATCSEIISTYFMHAADGFSKPLEVVLACIFYAGSFVGFNLSLRALELSIAYAVWSAVVMGTLSFMGMAFFKESVSRIKIAGITCIGVGTICLNLASTG